MARNVSDDEGEYRLNVRFPVEIGMQLKRRAETNRRSINNEILCLIENGMKTASGTA